ncbi:uncharacterized protein LOC110734957 [Chenopodium quinoa]|uniref:uncharacterized protein LOC110734957 n=1 Tax=Chenopodium quinoa TaxID=63459 RepID=UPI000B7890AE|nr:uncharacterized protein LOC110734957 [Chenopodium quinoa]
MDRKVLVEEKHLHTAIFTMVIALLMLCFRRAVVVSLVEQWRARIFLLLNLVLLAVLFTSLHFCTGSSAKDHHGNSNVDEKIVANKHKSDVVVTKSSVSTTCNGQSYELTGKKTTSNVVNSKVEKDMELSEEELNRRVEAFIATFKQQLISDSKRRTRDVSASKSRGYTKQLFH